MKTKKVFFFTLITSLIFTSALYSTLVNKSDSFLQDNEDIDNNNLQVIEDYSNEVFGLKNSATFNPNRTATAEQISRWLRKEWLSNNWTENGETILGQKGVAGIGDFFVELYSTTNNATYRSWAVDVATWLLGQRSGYTTGKWPNKVSEFGVQNYSSYLEGAAGIGKFFINLWEISNNVTHKNVAENVHTYLESIKTDTATGSVWEEKEETSTIAISAPSSSRTLNNGSEVTTFGDNIKYHDGQPYTYDSSNDVTDVDYYINLKDIGLLDEDLNILNTLFMNFTIKLSIEAILSAPTTSNISIYNWNTNKFESRIGDQIDLTKKELSFDVLSNFDDYGKYGIRIKVNTSDNTAHQIEIDTINITAYYKEYNSSSYSYGAAGIGDFYMDLYDSTFNPTYLDRATRAANYALEQLITTSNGTSWLEKGFYYTGIDFGTTGIANFLLKMYQNTTTIGYQTAAISSAYWLLNHSNSISSGIRWGIHNSSMTYSSGIDYNAGTGDFLLNLGKEIGNQIFIDNASQVGDYLTSSIIVTKQSHYGNTFYPYYQWKNNPASAVYDYTYSIGGAGALQFVDAIFKERNDTTHGEYLSRGIEWIINTLNITATNWGGDKTGYNIPNGIAGIGRALNTLEVKRPRITEVIIPNQLEFNSDRKVTFNIINYTSFLPGLYPNQGYFIRYAYGLDYQSNIWTELRLNNTAGTDNYWCQFPLIPRNNTWHYVVYAVDNNDTFTLYNNGSEYQLDIVDTFAPATTLVAKYGAGIPKSGTGYLEIRLEQNDANGWDFDKVYVNIAALGRTNEIFNVFTLIGSELVGNLRIDTGPNVQYNQLITVSIDTLDLGGNSRITSTSFYIIDVTAPTKTSVKPPDYNWIPQFTAIPLEATVSDESSGLSNTTGAFIYYTLDKGTTWLMINLTRSGDKFVGEIPGQVWLSEVYYVYGARDNANNVVIWDVFDNSYTSIYSIGLHAMFSFTTTINWIMILLVVGVIALITVAGYLIYSRRGDYLTKMRRKSKATATGLVIKERLTNFYFKLQEGVNKLGEKIASTSSGMGGKIGLWGHEHVGDKTKSFFKGIGKFLWAFPKAFGNSIRYFFEAIGKVFTKSKAWQVITMMLFGIIMVISTVVQFIMEAGYPIRAVLFANLGFLMFISGIIIFLIKFIYKLAYK